MKKEIDTLGRKEIITFRDTLVKYLYDLKTDDPFKIIDEVYRLLTELSNKMK